MRRTTHFAMFFVCVGAIALHTLQGHADPSAELRRQFEERYQRWQDALSKPNSLGPNSSIDPGWAELHAIVALGPQVTPLLIEKLEQTRSAGSGIQLRGVVAALGLATWKRFPKSAWPDGKFAHPAAEAHLFLKWWRKDRKNVPTEFARLYDEWREHVEHDQPKQADAVLTRIKDMGLDVLPLVVAKIQAGDDALVPLVNRICRRKVAGEDPTRERVLAWWKREKDKWTLPAYEEPKKKQ